MAPKPLATPRPIDIGLARPRPAISVAVAVADRGPCRYQYSACSDTERWGGTVEADSADAALLDVICSIGETCDAERIRFVVHIPVRGKLWRLCDHAGLPIPGIWIEQPASLGDVELMRQARAELGEAAPAPVSVATDGSVRGRFAGYGWLASSGEYNLVDSRHSRKLSGHEAVLVAELRAIGLAVRNLRGRDITVLTDSTDALNMVNRWMADDDVMPRGYAIDRENGKAPGLVRAQRNIYAERDRITLVWVKGHSGHPLNSGANALARLASRYAKDKSGLEVAEYRRLAQGLAESFSREFNGKRTAARPPIVADGTNRATSAKGEPGRSR